LIKSAIGGVFEVVKG